VGVLRSKLFQAALILVVSFLIFRFGIRPPAPWSVLKLYMAIVLLAVLVYVSSDSDSWRTFVRPIRSTIVDDSKRPLRLALLLLFPILAGYYAYTQAAARIEAPPELRVVHPAPPASISFRGRTIDIQGLENPLRNDPENFATYVQQGGEIYIKNCVYCHGDHLDGKGHFAHGFNPLPADFRDPGTIAMLQESYLFWRIAKGGPGLPRESAPWNSAMPAWEDRLSEDETWKVILYLYEAAGVKPRRWEAHAGLSALRGIAQFGPGDAEAQAADLDLGKQVYEKRCALCHGVGGKGDGAGAPFLDPRPRDFTRGLYKIRSTPGGAVPTDDDLFTVITEGMPGTSMPGWRSLSERERRAVVQYVKTFSDRFAGEQAPKPIQIGPAVTPSQGSVEKGRQLYEDLECYACHGKGGRGDGASAPTLKDAWEQPIRPANLTKRWTFRGGPSTKAIYIRFNTGIAGTPMPDYSDSIEPEQSWHLSNFVASLGPERPHFGTLLRAVPVSGDLPATVDDPMWNEFGGVNFSLVGQVIADPRKFTPSIDMVSVKSAYNDAAVAFLVAWDDPTPGGRPGDDGSARPDALAIQFPAKPAEGGARPYFLMGDSGHPAYLLRWRSDEDRVEELEATGLGRLRPAPPGSVTGATGTAVHREGQYRLLVTRPLPPPGEGVPGFERGRFIPIAFFAWDGGNGETESKMSLSTWYYLFLEEPPSARRLVLPPLAALATGAVELLIVRGVRRRYRAERR
jgi:DMSO reductase family type II enzyme heme b subunit